MRATEIITGVAIASLILAVTSTQTCACSQAPGGGGGASPPPKGSQPAQPKPPAAANDYDKYFASRIDAVPTDTQFGRNNVYAIVFTPTRNDYEYHVEFAGKNLAGGNACWRGDQAHRFSLDELKNKQIVTQVGGNLEVKGEKGAEGSTVSGGGGGNASVNQTKNIDVNRVFGSEYASNPLVVHHEFHYRVVVSQGNKVLSTTPWSGAALGDITTWNWPASCSWVKQKA